MNWSISLKRVKKKSFINPLEHYHIDKITGQQIISQSPTPQNEKLTYLNYQRHDQQSKVI